MERILETLMFRSRWLLAPMYLGLVGGLLILLIKFGQEFLHIIMHIFDASEREVVLSILALVDMTLIANLLIMVIFSGYENFVSKIEARDHPDWPEWMAKIDFSGLKLKLLSSIVAISGIQLLKSFMDIHNISDRDLIWYVAIHMTFVVSGLMLAWTDRISAEKH